MDVIKPTVTHRWLRRIGSAAVLAGTLCAATPATAAPAAGASAKVGTSGSSASTKGKKGGGYDWPEVVVSGNAISFLAPLQFGLVNYLPKARFAFQYDRQIRKGHWVNVGIGALFDRGNYRTFKTRCGLDAANGACDKGGVVGVDAYLGYTYRFFLDKRPWLVPFVKGSIGYSYFDLPRIGGGSGNREQERVHSHALTIRPGGGLRLFLLDQLGIGMDVALPLGFLVHKVRDSDTGEERKDGDFLLGIEVLPLVVEYRF